MRIMITLCLKFMSITFCFGMEQKFQAQFNPTSSVVNLQKELSKQAQQITEDAITFSIQMVKLQIEHLPNITEFPPSTLYINACQLVEESLKTLAGFLNIASEQKLKIDLNPVQYTVNDKPQAFFTVSTAIDFSHSILLAACKKHINEIKDAPCFFVNTQNTTQYCNAETKYGLKQKKLYAIFDQIYKTPYVDDIKIRSYLSSELYKLLKIWEILTIPNCYA